MNTNPLNYILKLTEKIKPSMAYDGGDFGVWQQKARQKLTSLLGLPFEKCDDLLTIEYEQKHDSYNEKGGGVCRHVIGNEGHRFYYNLAWKAYDEVKV